MSASRMYEATFKTWAHFGNVMPETEHSESQYPSAELKPAGWLPVQRLDTKFEEYAVLNAGKVVALDREGRAVPAGLRHVFEAAAGATILTYAAADVTEGVIDLTTGVAVTAATSYTQTQVTAALRLRGLIGAAETARDFISRAVGYAPYSYWKWASGSSSDGFNPTHRTKHNHTLQSQVAIGTDKILQIPMVPAVETAETMGSTIGNGAIAFGTSAWISVTGIDATTRYASEVAATDSVVAYVFGEYPVAKITLNTPITDSGSTLAGMTEVFSITDVIAGAGDCFYIDYDAGVMFLYEAGGNAIPTGFSGGVSTITYYSYETAASGSTSIVQLVGPINVGDYVTFQDTSDYIKWTPDIGTASGGASGNNFAADPDYGNGADADISAQLEAAIIDAQTEIVGQVIAIWTWPRSGLDRVASRYTQLTENDRMPGTATQGMSDALNMSGGANKVAIINWMAR